METFSALLAICAGNSPVPGEFPTQRPVTRSFDVFFDLHPNKRLSKQWWGWWFETPPCPLWRHRNDLKLMFHKRYNPMIPVPWCEYKRDILLQLYFHVLAKGVLLMVNHLTHYICVFICADIIYNIYIYTYIFILYRFDSETSYVNKAPYIGRLLVWNHTLIM